MAGTAPVWGCLRLVELLSDLHTGTLAAVRIGGQAGSSFPTHTHAMLCAMLYADDLALVSHSVAELRVMLQTKGCCHG